MFRERKLHRGRIFSFRYTHTHARIGHMERAPLRTFVPSAHVSHHRHRYYVSIMFGVCLVNSAERRRAKKKKKETVDCVLALVHIWIVHSSCINNNVVWHNTCGNAIRCANRPAVCVCVEKNAKMMEGAHRFYSFVLLDYINDATEQNEHQHHPRMGRRLEMKFILESIMNKTRFLLMANAVPLSSWGLHVRYWSWIHLMPMWFPMPPGMRNLNAVSGVQKVAKKVFQMRKRESFSTLIFDESWIIYFRWRGGAQLKGENLYCVRFFMFAIVYRISNHHAKWKWNRIHILKIRFAIFIKDTLDLNDPICTFNRTSTEQCSVCS